MNAKFRQKSRNVEKECFATLLMVVVMLIGFSNPSNLYATSELNLKKVAKADAPQQLIDDLDVQQRSLAMTFSTQAVDAEFALQGVEQAGEIQGAEQAGELEIAHRQIKRPFRFSTLEPLNSILGGVHGDVWLATRSHSNSDTDQPRQFRRPDTTVGNFNGVGFPDIRTHKRKPRSPFDPPGLWAPLVDWRDSSDDSQLVSEPIARVRCMGLTPKQVANRADEFRELIYETADRYDVSRHLAKAVISVESCFDNKALSSAGAQGLMQLMPDTATWLKVSDPLDPAQNVRAGLRYLASLQEEFVSLDLALAAYNAGPGNVRHYKGVPPFAETRSYVAKVLANQRRYEAAHSLIEREERLVRDEIAYESSKATVKPCLLYTSPSPRGRG